MTECSVFIEHFCDYLSIVKRDIHLLFIPIKILWKVSNFLGVCTPNLFVVSDTTLTEVHHVNLYEFEIKHMYRAL